MAKKPKKPLSIRECKAAGWDCAKAQWQHVWSIFLVAQVICALPVTCNRIRFLLERAEMLTLSIEIALILGCILSELFVCGVIRFGGSVVGMKMVAAQSVSMKTLFCGFRRYGKVMGLSVTNSLLTVLWSLLLIVPGIIKGYAYSMSYYILAENPDMSIRDARRESVRMMKGHKWQLFLLNLSFIGWSILSTLTLGAINIWAAPYRGAAVVHFYQSIKDHQSPRGNLTVDRWD